MKLIPLTQGKFAMVDDADYEAVSQFKWCVIRIDRRCYAVRSIRKSDGKWTKQYMHRFLMPGVAGIDHRDGNGLNNSRENNLRPATTQQNSQGLQRKKLGATSKFRGVCWNKRLGKWQVLITVDGKKIHLGYFTDENDAGRARDAATRKYHTGGFLQLNFP